MNVTARRVVPLYHTRSANDETPNDPIAAEAIPFERVSLADAKRVYEGSGMDTLRRDRATRYPARRREVLEEATAVWLACLPDAARPVLLARRFPRVANKICALWPWSGPCTAYLSGLLIVREGSRQGFPVPVATDIYRLSVYYAALQSFASEDAQ